MTTNRCFWKKRRTGERRKERRKELNTEKHSFYFSVFPEACLNHSTFDVGTVAVMQIAFDFNQIIWGLAA